MVRTTARGCLARRQNTRTDVQWLLDRVFAFQPLSIAAQEGYLEVVRLLLEKGAAIEAKTNYRGAPVSTAEFYSNPAIVKVLAVKGTVEAVGATPLYIAAKEGHLAVVKLLL